MPRIQVEFKGSLEYFHTPGETEKRRIKELLGRIVGLNVALLQVKLRKSEYRIFYNEEMDIFFKGSEKPLEPVEKWIRDQMAQK